LAGTFFSVPVATVFRAAGVRRAGGLATVSPVAAFLAGVLLLVVFSSMLKHPRRLLFGGSLRGEKAASTDCCIPVQDRKIKPLGQGNSSARFFVYLVLSGSWSAAEGRLCRK
jgi:hypothetical protein